MAQAKRNEVRHVHDVPPHRPGDRGYEPGGQIAQMQADLAHRLMTPSLVTVGDAETSVERLIRSLSVGGGYLALLTAYAATATLILR